MTILDRIGKIVGLHRVDLDPVEPFIDTASRFAGERGTVCLLSGGNLDCARYHMLALRPYLVFSGRRDRMSLEVDGETAVFDGDPFETLSMILACLENPEVDFPGPVSAALFGYLSYDLKDAVETLPRTTADDLGLPSIWFAAPSALLVHDKTEGRTSLFIPRRETDGTDHPDHVQAWFMERMSRPLEPGTGYTAGGDGFVSNFDRETYMEAIVRIREYIAAGDIYQVNMSQRFEMDFAGDAFHLFRDLYGKNPAPFYAYVNAGDHRIVSTSPERFIKRTGGHVETRPIKGTRPRSADPEADLRLKRELSESRKDDAELSMIVDLMRNDIGKVCRGGSVRVTEHKRVEAYANVYHLISIVEGELDPGMGSVDLIKATFPGGSITGCPKIRSMEIIDELETNRRHLYTGSIGYLGVHGTMDLSIAIRTATITGGRLVFSVGGGVVYDSDPEDEYNETLHKGKTLIDTLRGSTPSPGRRTVGWLDGALKPADRLNVPVTALGLQYGHGFFETLRVDRGRILGLDEHLERLFASWRRFFRTETPDLTFDAVIGQVIDGCGLGDTVAAVKIMAFLGKRDQVSVLVTARPYTHRLVALKKNGLDLVTCGSPRQSELAGHKSMNYQYYYLEGTRAREKGGDEALILNPDGSVSETNTANLLFVRDRSVVLPMSGHVLPGIMENRVKRLLASWGYSIERRPVFPGELAGLGRVIATNALMGAVPVRSLDGVPLPEDDGLCGEINRHVLNPV